MSLKVLDLGEVRLRYYVFGSGEPRVLVTAGIHGDEVTGVYTAYRLIEHLSIGKRLNGSVVVVPVVNVLGFVARTRLNPVDYVDLNRVFPDGAGSIITKRIVRAVWELAEQSSYVLDLHCAGLNSYQYILALHKDFPKVKQFTDLIQWNTVVESTGLRGQLFVEATHRGIPSAIIETVGGDGYYSREWGEKLLNVVLGTLRALGVLEDGEKPRATEKRYYEKLVHVESPAEGFPNPVVEPGRDVVKGDVLGYVGGKIITSPATSKLIRVTKNVYIFEKETFASIASVEEV